MTEAEKYFDEVCLGHSAAREFCLVFHNWVHWIDDAVDQTRTYTVEETARITLEAVFTFSENPFFQEHKTSLVPLIAQAVLSWESSVEWEQREDYRDYVASQVFKSYYHEVYWHVALIVGGWEHARKTVRDKRKVDYDVRASAKPRQLSEQRERVHESVRQTEAGGSDARRGSDDA